MSIASEISRLSSNISDSLDAVAAKGVTVPSDSNSDDLPGLIASIVQSTPAIAVVDTPDSHGGTVREITALNISDSTLETADQLANGVTGYNKYGVKLTGTAAGGSIKRIAIRPDAELWKSWTYDKRIVADEGITIPPYQATTVTLKGTEQIDEITADAANYKYFLTFRTLVIPEYNTDETGRGRYEWSSMVGAYEFVFTPMAELHPLVDGAYKISTNSAAVQGGVSYRSLYFTSSTGISIYATTAYGIWTTAVPPAYTGGKMKINSPNFTMRAQTNIFDQLYYEALTDIRFQYVYELWRVPIGSLQYDGWSNQQSVDKALDCLYSASHTLT